MLLREMKQGDRFREGYFFDDIYEALENPFIENRDDKSYIYCRVKNLKNDEEDLFFEDLKYEGQILQIIPIEKL